MSELVTPAIRVRHLWHRFGPFEVLRDVSFEVMPGEIFGFIGPNGAGKTTTIRILTTLLEPLAGRVSVDGFDVSLEPEKVRKVIGYMPDHAGVYERVTTREYLEFFADAYGVSQGGNYSVVDAVMELTDLNKLSDKIVSSMSKGMKQRLQLARTLLHDPKVLILDEPASDLDPRARIEMRDLLVELRDLGKTIFLSSHILTELADVCTSVAILERGHLVVAGPISEIARKLEGQRMQAQPAPMHAPQGYAPAMGAATVGSPMTQGMPLDAGGVIQPQGPSAFPRTPLASAQGAPSPHTAPPVGRGAKIRALAPLDVMVATIRSVHGVLGVESTPTGKFAMGTTVLVTYAGDEQVLSLIVRSLVMSNIAVVGVEPERNELERIFLEVTKGELQ